MTHRLLFVLAALFTPVLASAQEPAPAQAAQTPPTQQSAGQLERRTVAAVRLNDTEAITLDGRLDEAVWQRAVPATNFIQVDPDNGKPATEQTEVRIVFTADALYMGVTAHDSEPDRWLGYQRRRDELLESDDRFIWAIDTYLDGRSSYYFEMNPSGLMGDALRGVGVSSRQWDGIWNARARRSEIGWTLEIEIPFRTLNFNPNNDTWGINFQRTVRRKNEDSLWMGWARNQGLNRMTNAGLVTGLREVSQGRGLDIKPYALATAASSPGRGVTKTATDAQAGVDLFYSLTPQMRANLTVNTDFAQTEVDQRQVNLTRFSLFFPEKRDFFLDGSTFFDFGSAGGGGVGGSRRVIPFFSRRIGLSANATPQRIDFGSKLTGQVGQQDLGLLHVRTGEDDGLIGEDFTVARVKRRLLAQSYVGAMYTRRHQRVDEGSTQQTVGLDMRLATSSLLGSENLDVAGYYLHASNRLDTGQSSAYGLSIEYPNDLWNAHIGFREVQENFTPALGFVTRTGYRQYTPVVTYSPRPRQHPLIRFLSFSLEFDIQTDMRNVTLERTVEITPILIETQTQDTVALEIAPTYQRLDEDFDISRGITLPVGKEYDFTNYTVRGRTASRRAVAFDGRFEWGDFFSGNRKLVEANLTFRVRPGVIIYTGSEWNRINLAEGAFETRLFRIVPEVQFSPWTALVNNIQYDSVSGVLGWQSRFRWIIRPGNDVYVVYSHNWVDNPVLNRFSTLDRRAATKVLYTHRF